MRVRRVGLVEMEAAIGADALHEGISAAHIEGRDHRGRLGFFHRRYAQRLRGLLGRPGLFTVQEPERERSNQAHANRTSTSHPKSVPGFPRAPLRGVEGPGGTRQRPTHVEGTSSSWSKPGAVFGFVPLGSGTTMPSLPRIVCFDLGGVLVRICRSWDQACTHARLPYRAPELLATEAWRLRRKAVVDRFLLGGIAAAAYYEELSRALDGVYSVAEVVQIHEAWSLS